MNKLLLQLAESGKLSEAILVYGIRRLLHKRLKEFETLCAEQQSLAQQQLVEAMKKSPLALATQDANEQHYEVPAAFFEKVLGRRLKYSCALFKEVDSALQDNDLDAAEERMLALSCERAEVKDGMDILELGCGWGSLTLWLAEKYPKSRITAVSNSASQREFILKKATAGGLTNIQVVTVDMNHFTTTQQFDRVISIEMFEHMRNYELLFERISQWLKPSGKLFFHIFTQRSFAYFFEDRGEADWMSRHFFTGGIMPSDELPLFFQKHLLFQTRWTVDGRHYARTADAWLKRLERNKKSVLTLLSQDGNLAKAKTGFYRWRLFFLACRELWGYQGGTCWHVCHYLFQNRGQK